MQRNRHSTAAWAALLIVAVPLGAYAAGGGEPGEGYVAPYKMEPVDGGERVRITLTEKAIGRLGIETSAVTTEKADRTFVIGGDVVGEPPKSVGATTSSNLVATNSPIVPSQAVWISFPITEDIEKSAHLPIRVRALNGGEAGSGTRAMANEALNKVVTAEGGGKLYFKTSGNSAGLAVGQRVLVEVPYAGNDKDHTVVPYASIIYDKNGDEWTYVSPEPAVYVRESIDIAYIDGDKVFLIEGPEPGTAVVTVGAAELLGIEYKVGY